jgi:hypothetical protein
MLIECKNVSQPEAGIFRKWYADDGFELIVWFKESVICGFQLCYRLSEEMNALTYNNGRYSHDKVDEGGKWNETPILTGNVVFQKEKILKKFDERAAEIEPVIREYVVNKINGYMGS